MNSNSQKNFSKNKLDNINMNMNIAFLDCEYYNKDWHNNKKIFNNKKEYKQVMSIKEFQLNFLNNNDNHCIFEILESNTKIKPFYDLDKGFKSKEEFDNTHEDLLKKFQTFLYSMYPSCNLAIAHCHGWKGENNFAMSFHIVINNYETTINELREYNERFNIYNKFDFVDKAVYRTYGLMKCLNGTKPWEKRYKKIFVNNDPLKHLITSNKETNTGFEPLPSPPVSPVSKPINELVLEIKEEDKKDIEIIEDKKYIEIIEEKKEIKKVNISFGELTKTLFDIKNKWLHYDDIIKVCMAFFNVCVDIDELDDGYIILDKWIEKGKPVWKDMRPDRSVDDYHIFLKKEWKYWKKRNNNCDKKLSYGSLVKWSKDTEEKEIEEKEKDPNYNKYEEWYKEGINKFMDKMNDELMRNKNNEYIQIKDDDYYLHSNKGIINEYCKFSFEIEDEKNKKKIINPFNIWHNNIKRRDVIGLKFDPCNINNDKYYNIFKGFPYKLTNDIDENKIKPFIDHIKNIWANGKESCSEYILNWFSHIFQKPNVKTKSCIVATGMQGNGKTIIVDKVGNLLGKKLFLSTASSDNIIGQFNEISAGKLLINMNEAIWGGNKKEQGKLKELITDQTRGFSNKNVKSYLLEDYANLIVTSNERNPVPVEKTNRRFYMIEMKMERLTKSKAQSIVNVDDQILYNYFMNRDITDFNPEDFEHTKLEQEQKEFSQSSEVTFWLQVLQDEYISLGQGNGYSFQQLKEKDYCITKEELYNAYYIGDYGYGTKLGNAMFFKYTKQMFDFKTTKSDKYKKPNIILKDIVWMKKKFDEINNSSYFS